MRTVELFCGTKSFSKVMEKHGHDTWTTDIDPVFEASVTQSVLEPFDIPYWPNMLWASPPCEGFSVAAIGKNWNHDNTPKTDSARLGVQLAERTIEVIRDFRPTWWFIENPRGKLRKLDFMKDFLIEQGGVRHTVWYCRYGDTRAKPTDIWTNATWWIPREACKNGNKDHIAAPRGSSTGTQGIKTYADRSRIPAALFEEILEQMPKENTY